MRKVLNVIDKYFLQYIGRLANLKWMQAIKNGGIATLPLILVGAIFLIIENLPTTFQIDPTWINTYWDKYSTFLNNVNQYTFQGIGLFMTFGIGFSAAQYDTKVKMVPFSGGLLAASIFLTFCTAYAYVPNIHDGAFIGMKWSASFQLNRLGGVGIFVGIITAVYTHYIYRTVEKYNITVKLPKSVPVGVANSFRALVPLLFCGIISFGASWGLAAICYASNAPQYNDFQKLLGIPFKFLTNIALSLPGALVTVMLVMLLWCVGIHGSLIVQNLVQNTILIPSLAFNIAAHSAGQPMPYVITQGFFDLYIYIGGAGATFGAICLILIFGRSKQFKFVARASVGPGIFNINEPFVFGTPVIYNTYLLIPYVFAPMIMCVWGWIFVHAGLVGKIYAAAPWTMPAPISAFLETGDWKAILLSLSCIVIGTAIWAPFIFVYDKILLRDELLKVGNQELVDLIAENKEKREAQLNKYDELRKEFRKKIFAKYKAHETMTLQERFFIDPEFSSMKKAETKEWRAVRKDENKKIKEFMKSHKGLIKSRKEKKGAKAETSAASDDTQK